MSLVPGRRWLVLVCLTATIGWADIAAGQTLTLTWDHSPDPSVVGYIVYAGTQSGEYTASFNVGPATSFAYGVAPDQPYFFAVASYTAGMIVGPVSDEVVGFARTLALLPDPGDQLAVGSPTVVSVVDVTSPVVTITLPAALDRLLASARFIAVGGLAVDDNGIAAVTWSNSRGGSGVATGTEAWLAGVVLHSGRNDITITASDRAGNLGTATFSVYRQTLSP